MRTSNRNRNTKDETEKTAVTVHYRYVCINLIEIVPPFAYQAHKRDFFSHSVVREMS